MFDSLTYKAISVTITDETNIGGKGADVSMHSFDQRQDDHPSLFWDKYVREMSPFYFNLLSEYFYAISASQLIFEQEDVNVLKDIGLLFKVSTEDVQLRPAASKALGGGLLQDLPLVKKEHFTICGLVSVPKQLLEIIQSTMRLN